MARKRFNSNLVTAVAVTLGIFGAFGAGVSVGLLNQETDNFTDSQTLYIDGAARGAAFEQTKQEIERNTPPSVDENNLLRNPHERCIKEYYPSQPLMLAGCLDAVDHKVWSMP